MTAAVITQLRSVPETIGPREFWQSREVFQQIQQFAAARRVSKWALLGCVMVRALSAVTPDCVLTATIGGEASLNTILGIVGPSGSGKNAVLKSAAQFIQPRYEITFSEEFLGSGEGVIAAFVAPRKQDDGSVTSEMHTESVIFSAEEIDTAAALMSRQGATISSVIRGLGLGEGIGFRNRSSERSASLKAMSYRASVVFGIQPDHSGPLLNDATGGLAQRLLWMPTIENADEVPLPGQEPELPELMLNWVPKLPPLNDNGRRVYEIPKVAKDAIVWAHYQKRIGQGNPLDGHALLTRLKVAVALNLISGAEPVISEEDWLFAGVVMEISNQTRQSCLDALRNAARESNLARAAARGEAELATDLKVTDAAIAKARERILAKVSDTPISASKIRQGMAKTLREYFEAALDDLEAEGVITVREIEYHGNPGKEITLASR